MDYSVIGGADGPTAILVARQIGFGWNWINWFGVIIVVLLMIPNIVYALKYRGEKNLCENKLINIMEQIGRYGSMLFMMVYLGIEDGFGFSSIAGFFCYGFGSLALLVAYWIVWCVYFHVRGGYSYGEADGPTSVFVAGKENVRKVAGLKLSLAILPTCLFLLCGITLQYVPLIVCGVIFAISHIFVTCENSKKRI